MFPKLEPLSIVGNLSLWRPDDSQRQAAASKGRHRNPPQYDDKNMLGNIGDPFVKCMQQVTKGHLYCHLLGVSDYYVMYRQRIQSVL